MKRREVALNITKEKKKHNKKLFKLFINELFEQYLVKKEFKKSSTPFSRQKTLFSRQQKGYVERFWINPPDFESDEGLAISLYWGLAFPEIKKYRNVEFIMYEHHSVPDSHIKGRITEVSTLADERLDDGDIDIDWQLSKINISDAAEKIASIIFQASSTLGNNKIDHFKKEALEDDKQYQKPEKLLYNIKAQYKKLKKLLKKAKSENEYEDPIYRYYHSSLKVYWIQNMTQEMFQALESIAPEGKITNQTFLDLVNIGANGEQFDKSHNQNWDKHTRPMLEAYFHARYFLEMAVKYGKKLDELPTVLPTGWAALLYLYEVR